MDSKRNELKSIPIHYVSSTESTEFTQFIHALKHSIVIGLDAEWKPIRTKPSIFPTVSLLQRACRVKIIDSNSVEENGETDVVVFLVDLLQIDISSIWGSLNEMFVSGNILKLGFRFKQDLAYLSSTFCSHGCDPGFDKVKPFIDIASIYRHLQPKRQGRKLPKDQKGLAAICQEVLGVSLSKELQCSDWSCRPLTEEQKRYAAADAQCLLDIFDIFQGKILKEGISLQSSTELHPSHGVMGSKEVLKTSDTCNNIFRQKCSEASDVVRSTLNGSATDCSLSELVLMYGEELLLKESDRYPKTSKKRVKKHAKNWVIQKFNLKICEDQLMSRCVKCNMSIKKPLTIEEAIEASKGFQKIPSCLFNHFWQCIKCKQLYWEGRTRAKAIEKFIDICQLNK